MTETTCILVKYREVIIYFCMEVYGKMICSVFPMQTLFGFFFMFSYFKFKQISILMIIRTGLTFQYTCIKLAHYI